MQHITLPKDNFYASVGLIPATDKTPDIYYCADPSSEKVAALTFLTLWFLDAAIQQQVKERASSVICGLSPLAGGRRLEKLFSSLAGVSDQGTKYEEFDVRTDLASYTGACTYPKWENGELISQGYIAIYATDTQTDIENKYTEKWKLLASHTTPEYNSYYSLHYSSESTLGVHTILKAFSLPDRQRNAHLADILKNEFFDINPLYDMVPKRVGHEVTHLLEYGNGLEATPSIIEEVEENIPSKNFKIKRYRIALEAIAELGGIALLNQVRRNAGLNFGIPTTRLNELIPNAYDYVEERISRISRSPLPK